MRWRLFLVSLLLWMVGCENSPAGHEIDDPVMVGITLTVELAGGVPMEFVWVNPGMFIMNEQPVTLTQGFYLGTYEMTQGQWEAVMGTTPWSGREHVQSHPNHPAVYISWLDVREMIATLNRAVGEDIYRFPTSAEWEVASRAGTTTRWPFGDDDRLLGDYAWYEETAWKISEKYAHAIGTKLPNLWGFHDMLGNVSEWCQDWWGESLASGPQTDPTGPRSGSLRVYRGGDFSSSSSDVLPTILSGVTPAAVGPTTGVRLVRIGSPAEAD